MPYFISARVHADVTSLDAYRSIQGNGQKRELPVLFCLKTGVPENKSGRECYWPYLIGKHLLSPAFGQKRSGAPDYGYFAQLPPVFGHFMFLSAAYSNRPNRATRATKRKILPL